MIYGDFFIDTDTAVEIIVVNATSAGLPHEYVMNLKCIHVRASEKRLP